MAKGEGSSEMGNFNIQETMGAGAGNQQLINDLFGEDTTGANPDEIIPIIKDVDPPAGTTPPATTTAATTVAPTPTPAPDTAIADFLAGGGDGEEGSAEEIAAAAATAGGEESPIGDEPPAGGEPEGTPEGTPFETLSKELVDLGVFSAQGEGEEAITSPEQFLAKFHAEKQEGANQIVDNFIGQFGEDYQNAFDAIFVKGADPKEYFNTMGAVSDFANMDMEQESNQKLVLKQALLNQGFETADAEAEIERLENYGDLKVTADRHHRVLIKKESAKLVEMEEKARISLENKTAIKTEYTKNVRDVLNDKLKEKGFDGIPLNPKLANELHDFLLVDKYKTPSGETLTDFDRTILDLKRPENHSMKVKVGLLLKMLEKDPTLSTIQKTGVTKKTNELFGALARQVPKKPGNIVNKGAAPAIKRWFK